MITNKQMHLAQVFLKIFFRDRQSIIFNLLFPLIFMGVFVFVGGESEPINLGLVNNSSNTISQEFSELVEEEPLFNVTKGEENELKRQLFLGDQTAIIIIPESFNPIDETAEIKLLLDASQVRQIGSIKEAISKSLLSIERSLRNTQPMFTIEVEDEK